MIKNLSYAVLLSGIALMTRGNTVNNSVMEKNMLNLSINEKQYAVVWENNQSVSALVELATKKPIIINTQQYGGFERIGRLPQSIIRNDKPINVKAGDIVLYSGNSLVIFFDNSHWSYTKLGRIEGLTTNELSSLLNQSKVTIILSSEVR